jgi:glycosyltransferase involved in cell wall biosynthesis
VVVYDIIPMLHPDWVAPDVDRLFRVYLQQVLALADHIVVTATKVRSDLLALGWRIPGEIHVIGLGTTHAQRAPQPPPDGRISMMYVSTVEPRKGHDVLLGAFDLLRGRGFDVDLTLVGQEGWNLDEVVQAIRSHSDFGGRIRWFESADDLVVSALARDCSIGLFPSRDEGFGLFIEEGLSLGLKMVVSDIPVFRERAQPNLRFVELTAEALAQGILDAHATPWHPLEPGQVRTMRDFASDLSELVVAVLSRD